MCKSFFINAIRLVLDEPLNGLDPMARAEAIALFRDLAAEGLHVIISSHILHEVDKISDRVIPLSSGYIVAEGRIHDVRGEMHQEHPLQILIRCRRPELLAARVFEQDHVVEVKMHKDRAGLVVTTRDAERFYQLVNELVLEGAIDVESVTLWRAQIAALLRLELKKHFFARRAIPVYLLAAAPVLLFGIHGLLSWLGIGPCRGRADLRAFAGMFQVYYLRPGIFFGCVGIFMSLFRGEAVEKTLHYYFLSPVRRELLVVGKYLSGLVMGLILFGGGTVLSYLFMDLHSAPLRNQEILSATALGHIAGYTGVTALAVLGYGAVFLFLGLYLIPAGGDRVFAMTADPVPAYIGVPGLICLTLVIAASAVRIRGMEISYGGSRIRDQPRPHACLQ